MKLCLEDKPKKPMPTQPIHGRLYQRITGQYQDGIYLAGSNLTKPADLFNLETGEIWGTGVGFGSPGPEAWRDVTEDYCVKKAKP